MTEVTHPYQHDEPTGACRRCGYRADAPIHRGIGASQRREAWHPGAQAGQQGATPAPAQRQDTTVRNLLIIIAVLVAAVAFWVIATPHEQCYISDGGVFSVERPIERTGAGTYRGVPAEFRDGDYISAGAVIECRWELGEPYRVTLFGR